MIRNGRLDFGWLEIVWFWLGNLRLPLGLYSEIFCSFVAPLSPFSLRPVCPSPLAFSHVAVDCSHAQTCNFLRSY